MITTIKRCFKCGEEKPVEEFYRHPAMKDGRVGKCKACNKQDVRDNRASKLDYYREYDLVRAKEPVRKEQQANITSAWRKRDSRIMRAHNAVARALAAGSIAKELCSKEGCTSDKTLAHHESYDKPLDVVWYCQPHHKERHRVMEKTGLSPF